MSNSVTIFSTLFGSVYIFSISLALLNKSILESDKIPKALILINGATLVMSGSAFLYILSKHK